MQTGRGSTDNEIENRDLGARRRIGAATLARDRPARSADADQCQLSAFALLGAALLRRHREGLVEGCRPRRRTSRSSRPARRRSPRRRRNPGTSAERARCRPCSARRASACSPSASPTTNPRPMRMMVRGDKFDAIQGQSDSCSRASASCSRPTRPAITRCAAA